MTTPDSDDSTEDLHAPPFLCCTGVSPSPVDRAAGDIPTSRTRGATTAKRHTTRRGSGHAWSYGAQVTPYICSRHQGSIRITVPTGERHVSIEWTGLHVGADVKAGGHLLENLSPGVYHGVASSSRGERQRLTVNVPQLHTAVVLHYVTKPATRFPWNGVVEAKMENVPTAASFLWSGGAVTTRPVLEHARPGKYTVSLIHTDTMLLSLAPPATVGNMLA